MKAYDLIGAYGRGGGVTAPPTVYRALDFLIQRGFVHRIESLNAYIACVAEAGNHTAAFLVCDCCGAAAEIDPPPVETVRATAAAAGFEVEDIAVEVRGLCSECRSV